MIASAAKPERQILGFSILEWTDLSKKRQLGEPF
jgi:hypothetical protein